MKHDWPIKELGDICRFIGGGTPLKNREDFYKGSIPWATVRDMRHDIISQTEFMITEEAVRSCSTNIIPANNVVIATRVGLGKICFIARDTAINQDLRGIIPIKQKELSTRFLFWWFKSIAHLIEQEGTGATVQGVKLPFIKSLRIPVPPLHEQKRIVTILDEIADGIATATINVEKGESYARGLFESFLGQIDGKKEVLGNLVDIRTGKLDANAAVQGGKYPFFTCSRQVFSINEFAFDCEAILLAGNNAVGDFNVKHYRGKFNAYQRTYVITTNQQKRVSYRFLYFQMRRSLKAFKAQSVGAGTKFLKLDMIKNMEIVLPPVGEQARLASQMDLLLENTERLEAIYRQKIDTLAELKQTILQKAFAGALPARFAEAVPEAAE